MKAPGNVYKTFLDADGDAILVNCAVLYVDVLGTAENSVATNRQEILRQFLRTLEIAREEAMIEANEPWQAWTWFTDNVVVAFPIMPGHVMKSPALGSALRAATFIQLCLTVNGFLARCGITFGEIHMASHVAFGPALIEAVKLEGRAVALKGGSDRLRLRNSTVRTAPNTRASLGRSGPDQPAGSGLAIGSEASQMPARCGHAPSVNGVRGRGTLDQCVLGQEQAGPAG